MPAAEKYKRISVPASPGPVAGAGTACMAARENDRHFVGLDVSVEYRQSARARLKGTQRKLRFPASGNQASRQFDNVAESAALQ